MRQCCTDMRCRVLLFFLSRRSSNVPSCRAPRSEKMSPVELIDLASSHRNSTARSLSRSHGAAFICRVFSGFKMLAKTELAVVSSRLLCIRGLVFCYDHVTLMYCSNVSPDFFGVLLFRQIEGMEETARNKQSLQCFMIRLLFRAVSQSVTSVGDFSWVQWAFSAVQKPNSFSAFMIAQSLEVVVGRQCFLSAVRNVSHRTTELLQNL